MAKAPWINLNNWTLGMSSDEYTGGSFLYWENINISDSSKSFKISNRILYTDINNRAWNIIQLLWPYNVWNNKVVSFSDDGYIENDDTFYPSSTVRDIWWPILKRSVWYVNAIKVWTKTIWVTSDKLDLFTNDMYNWLFSEANNVVVNPSLISNTWWTVNTWWTTWVNWATHSSWKWLLTSLITVDRTKKQRIAINVTWNTTWTCVVKLDNSTVVWTITTSSPHWNTFFIDNDTATRTTIDFVPSTSFNWTIQYVSICPYSWIELDKVFITSSTSHPLYSTWGKLYIGSWAKIDEVNLTSYSIDTWSIIDSTHTIIWIHEIWQSLVIISTDWEDTKMSYWDRVSWAPSEVVLWKDKVATNSIHDWTMLYVLCESLDKKELYVASWYDKKLIALWTTWLQWNFWYDALCYRLEQRNDFYNNPLWTNAMWINWNKLLIPSYNWLYTYWYTNPNSQNALIKEWALDTQNVSVVANIWWVMYICYKTKSTNSNRIAYIRSYQNQLSTSGYVVTNPILRDNFSTKKQLNRLRLWYILPLSTSSIDIYVSVNKYNFRTFYVTGITTSPVRWDIYYTMEYSSPYNLYEVISTDITAWVGTISCKTINLVWFEFTSWADLVKVSGIGQTNISVSDSDNFIKIKTITCTWYTQWEELIFWQEFEESSMVDWHTVQFKIKLNTASVLWSPEIFDIPILAEPIWQNG